MRAFTILAVVAVALASMYFYNRPPATVPMPTLTYVATAHQLGVVGYRDPVGALSPDGRRLAYAEGRTVRVVPVAGGTSPIFPAAAGQVRWLTWIDDGRVLVEDGGDAHRWWAYDVAGATRLPLWDAAEPVAGGPRANDLRQPVVSADGQWLAAVAASADGPRIWRIRVDGSGAEQPPQGERPASPAWMPDGGVACLITVDGRPRVAAPCDATPIVPVPDIDAVGPIAFTPDGASVYFASPNERGTTDLWMMARDTGRALKLSAFSRDAYAPSVARDGTVLFRVQNYRTLVAELAAGRVRQLTTFQAETPWWHPRDPLISVTFGTWRRIIDDAKYPDIAQEIGVIDANRELADAPLEVIADSESEDQAMAWSPNGKWIALHSHRTQSDDVWLRPADGSAPDRRITMLGRGAEVGWPRWSPDGTTVLLDGANAAGKSVAYTIGVNQESGEVTTPLTEIPTPGLEADVMHAEWMPDGTRIAAVAREAPGRHVLFVVPVRWRHTHGRPSRGDRARLLGDDRVGRRRRARVRGARAGRLLPGFPRCPCAAACPSRSRSTRRTRRSRPGRRTARAWRSRCGPTRPRSGPSGHDRRWPGRRSPGCAAAPAAAVLAAALGPLDRTWLHGR
ncbi:MAG: hypothetical protein R2712_11495 [Vicinamibacterales bacterium]